ncbi:GMC oxidoreductase [Antarcticirhabdus aurantiaca]|uniref:GMC oxidoreductase n=1 Tax=Antarcticirhabdus aurantiaca TaxID=2606717 RepID=A0ACD4NX44_9HYPH|nr:GMC oxidoreductase [Antarcticirhabdus aurantiaca]WAJ31293.1 GMC oxidoreductase [Jeongeuplla avenae]
MGIDSAAVLTLELSVIGVDGLRVIDYSIIPQIPSGNTNAISLATGDRGAPRRPRHTTRVRWPGRASASRRPAPCLAPGL